MRGKARTLFCLFFVKRVSFLNLKKSIVIRNEFSNKYYAQDSKSLGSRGGSFQAYIIGYMARDMASDHLFPLESQENRVFLEDYSEYINERLLGKLSSLSDEVDVYGSLDVEDKTRMHKYDGLAFDDKSLSMTYDEVFAKSKQIQNAFDAGHSVQKFIISFTDEYLKEMNVLPKDFELEKRGDHFEQVDQLKLRQSIQDGMQAMMKIGGYEDPAWIGLIQLDTKHVHAHMVACDQVFAQARLKEDGLDRGKIYADEKTAFRNACTQSLERHIGLTRDTDQVSLLNQMMHSNLNFGAVNVEQDVVLKKQALEQLVSVIAEPELVYKERQKKVENHFEEMLHHPESLTTDEQSQLIGLQLAFERVREDYDLDEEEEEVLAQLWIKDASQMFLEDISEPTETQGLMQMMALLKEEHEADLEILDSYQGLDERSQAFVDSLYDELSGYRDRTVFQSGRGYDEELVVSTFLNRDTLSQQNQRVLANQNLALLAQQTTVPEDCQQIFQRMQNVSGRQFLGGNVAIDKLNLVDYFDRAFDENRLSAVAHQLKIRDKHLSIDSVVRQMNQLEAFDVENHRFDVDTLVALKTDDVIDDSIDNQVDVYVVENVENIEPEGVEEIVENALEEMDNTMQEEREDTIELEIENTVLEIEEPEEDKKDELFLDGLTLDEYLALHPELLEDEADVSNLEKQSEDELEI